MTACGGTAPAGYKGAAFNLRLQDAVKQATGLPTTSMSNGILEGLRSAGARRVAVATAYQDEVTARFARVRRAQSPSGCGTVSGC
jgi:arylmalonate decarboxylase